MDQARYAELFREEAREHLAELDTALIAFEQSADLTYVATLFRNTHNIKGMAAAMGYRVVEQLSHALESLLEGLRNGHVQAAPDVLELLYDGTDALRSSIDEAVAGRGDTVPVALGQLLQRLDAPQGLIASQAPIHAPSPMLAAPSEAIPDSFRAPSSADRTVSVRLVTDCPLKGVRALLVLARFDALGVVRQVEPPSSTWHLDSFDGAFDISVQTASAPDVIEAAARAAGDVESVLIHPIMARSRRDDATDGLRTVRVDRRRLDTLLELSGELAITRDRLLRLVEECDQGSTRALTRVAHETARLIGALHDEVAQARMVPVGQVFDRFPRLVRDVSRELAKDVEFVTEGRDIELDRSLLDAIGDPIVHLLRNALDHGIEDAVSRRRAGKGAKGQLVLRALRDRATVIIQVEDDGRGIDRQAILRRAQQQDIVARGVTSLDDDALLHVLAHPGFSTARAVTAISGRGVGVDVVSTRVRALGGTLEMETLQGQGTVFTLRLPVTLAIARALLVDVAGSTYALPASQVVEAIAYDAGTIVTTAARESLILRDEVVPLVHLRERFGHPRREVDSYVAVVEVGGRRTALLVDALVAQQDIVLKPLEAVRGGAPWFSGATVLGDGTPALIVDLGSLT